jgi:very-short-patch-repair endonuclease
VTRRANSRARTLRRGATDAERRLWSALRDRRLAGYKFRRQYPLNGAILDFACITHRLAVEADGGQHDVAADAPRTAAIHAAGWRVLRFWNNDILANTDGVVQSIIAALESEPCPPRP